MGLGTSNDFSQASSYYDLLVGGYRYKKYARFIARILTQHHVKTVLELGSGTGLYTIPLKKAGFEIVGLDISPKMIFLAKKKDKSIRYHKADMSKFSLKKRFDAILCLNSSLILLPTWNLIIRTINKCHTHLNKGGLLILDLPNHAVEIAHSDGVSKETFRFNGQHIEVISKEFKRANKWVAEWYGTVKKGKKRASFHQRFEELIFDPRKLESTLRSKGFNLLAIYGSRSGDKFRPKSSYRRLYVLKKF